MSRNWYLSAVVAVRHNNTAILPFHTKFPLTIHHNATTCGGISASTKPHPTKGLCLRALRKSTGQCCGKESERQGACDEQVGIRSAPLSEETGELIPNAKTKRHVCPGLKIICKNENGLSSEMITKPEETRKPLYRWGTNTKTNRKYLQIEYSSRNGKRNVKHCAVHPKTNREEKSRPVLIRERRKEIDHSLRVVAGKMNIPDSTSLLFYCCRLSSLVVCACP